MDLIKSSFSENSIKIITRVYKDGYVIDNHFIFLSLQSCVRYRATQSIRCVKDVSEEEARKAVDSVFDSCFKDTAPFEHIP